MSDPGVQRSAPAGGAVGGQSLEVTLSTWLYHLYVSGVEAGDDAVREACAAVDAAEEAEAGDAAGHTLVARVAALLGSDGDPAALARTLFGGDAVDTEMGAGTRDERTQRIRKYQFTRNLPWLARIWERKAGGTVAPSWLVVEQVTDQVAAMDPNPWDDIDEERWLPVHDFHVLWELDGCTAVAIR